MDPVALAAIVGLVFVGKTLSDPKSSAPPATRKPITQKDLDKAATGQGEHLGDFFDQRPGNPNKGARIGDWRLAPKQTVTGIQDISSNTSKMPYGQPVYDLYNRQFVTNIQKNLAPTGQPMTVGPGLGLAPDVPAGGGFQDYFRALPVNMNEERLTTLPGGEGPPDAVVKSGGAAYIGNITHEAKSSKTAYRAPAAYGGGGARGALTGAAGRPNHVKAKRMTIRAETGLRTDTLSTGTAQYKVNLPYGNATDKSLTRGTGNRSNADRAGNPGRMNVRNDPVNQVGAMSATRAESIPLQLGPVGPTTNRPSQGYKAPEFDKLNELKGNRNPYASPTSLDIAIQQLEKNPYALSLAPTVS